jgi:hypothetical protein
VRLVFHLTKRILRYDLPLSLAAALALGVPSPVVLAVRFVLIACTAGFLLSLFAYTTLGRRELPVYTVAGGRLVTTAAGALALVVASLSCLLALAMIVGRALTS